MAASEALLVVKIFGLDFASPIPLMYATGKQQFLLISNLVLLQHIIDIKYCKFLVPVATLDARGRYMTLYNNNNIMFKRLLILLLHCYCI